MDKDQKSCIIKSALLAILLPLTVVCLVFFSKTNGITITVLIALAFALLTALLIAAAIKNKRKIVSLSFYTMLIAAVILAGYTTMATLGWLEYLSSQENIQNLIGKSSPWGEIIFIGITFAQVTLVPIPSTITIIAGVLAFGVGPSIIYSTVGLIIGSMFAFFLGKTFGMKIVRVTIGEGMYNKYQNIVKGKDVMMLFLMFLLPLFPDDLLCIVAGLTNMSYLSFFIMMLITRPIGVSVTSISSKLLAYIPLSGWGLVVWGILAVLVIILAVLLMKYSNLIQDRMVYFFDTHFNKSRRVKGADLSRVNLNVYNHVSNAIVYSNNNFYNSFGGKKKKRFKKE